MGRRGEAERRVEDMDDMACYIFRKREILYEELDPSIECKSPQELSHMIYSCLALHHRRHQELIFVPSPKRIPHYKANVYPTTLHFRFPNTPLRTR